MRTNETHLRSLWKASNWADLKIKQAVQVVLSTSLSVLPQGWWVELVPFLQQLWTDEDKWGLWKVSGWHSCFLVYCWLFYCQKISIKSLICTLSARIVPLGEQVKTHLIVTSTCRNAVPVPSCLALSVFLNGSQGRNICPVTSLERFVFNCVWDGKRIMNPTELATRQLWDA